MGGFIFDDVPAEAMIETNDWISMTAQMPFELLLGHPQIDGQHRQIFQIVSDFQETMDNGQGPGQVGRTLSPLALIVYAHFKLEEDLMAQAGFPGLAAHSQAHEKIRDRVEGMVDQHHRGELPAQALADFMTCWLTEHVQQYDAAMVKFLAPAGVTE